VSWIALLWCVLIRETYSLQKFLPREYVKIKGIEKIIFAVSKYQLFVAMVT